jgi:hypothetical protein
LSNRHLPTLQALILAERIYTDGDTKKHVIAGTFDTIGSPAYPLLHSGPWAVFCSLTEVRGRMSVELRMVDGSDHKVIMRSMVTDIEAPDPLSTVEIKFDLPPQVLQHEGVYHFELLAGDRILGSKRFHAKQI